jgi:hypothetical protein
LTDSGFELVGEGVKCKWQPDEDALTAYREFGRKAGAATLKEL